MEKFILQNCLTKRVIKKEVGYNGKRIYETCFFDSYHLAETELNEINHLHGFSLTILSIDIPTEEEKGFFYKYS